MVDEGRVARLLRSVADRTGRLRSAFASDPDERGDLWMDGVKYLFVTSIEGCIDVAQHIASSEHFGAPDSNAAAIRVLGDRGVIEAELARSLAKAVGFRNVLVHQYTDVDDQIVLAASGRLDELTAFVAQVSSWLESQRD